MRLTGPLIKYLLSEDVPARQVQVRHAESAELIYEDAATATTTFQSSKEPVHHDMVNKENTLSQAVREGAIYLVLGK